MKTASRTTRRELRWKKMLPLSLVVGKVVRATDPSEVLAYVGVLSGTAKVHRELCKPSQASALERMMAWAHSAGAQCEEDYDLCVERCRIEGRVSDVELARLMDSLAKTMVDYSQLCPTKVVDCSTAERGESGNDPAPNASVDACEMRKRPGRKAGASGGPESRSFDDAAITAFKEEAARQSRTVPKDLDPDEVESRTVERFLQTYGRDGTSIREEPGALVKTIMRRVIAEIIEQRNADRRLAARLKGEAKVVSSRRHTNRQAMLEAAHADAKIRIENMLGRDIAAEELAALRRIDELWERRMGEAQAIGLLRDVLTSMSKVCAYSMTPEINHGGMPSIELHEIALQTSDGWRAFLRDFWLFEEHEMEALRDQPLLVAIDRALDALSNWEQETHGRLRFLTNMLDRYDVFGMGRRLKGIEIAAVAVFMGIDPKDGGSSGGWVTGKPFQSLSSCIRDWRRKKTASAEYLPSAALPEVDWGAYPSRNRTGSY